MDSVKDARFAAACWAICSTTAHLELARRATGDSRTFYTIMAVVSLLAVIGQVIRYGKAKG